jgi:hypothetical protein
MHDDEKITINENITSQLIMSSIDPNADIRIRDSNSETSSNENNQTTLPNNERPTREADMNFTRLLTKMYNHMDQLRYRMQRETFKKCTNNEWLLVATLVNKILFLTYFMIIFFTTKAIFKSAD